MELNEAFAVQVVASAKELGIDPDKLNVNGGAIALGHPFGMTGARMTTTLLNGLRERDGQLGLATLCVGGGQGMAVVLERLAELAGGPALQKSNAEAEKGAPPFGGAPFRAEARLALFDRCGRTSAFGQKWHSWEKCRP